MATRVIRGLMMVGVVSVVAHTAPVAAAPVDQINAGWADDGTVVRLRTSTDNVGIGTATPGEKLEVAGNVKLTPTIEAGETAILGQPTGGSGFNSYNWLDFKNLSGSSVFAVGYYGDTVIATKLAIGTSPGAARLHIGGTSLANPATIRLGSGASGANFQLVAAPQDQLLDLQLDNGTSLLALQSAGNVGIGTTAPTEKLQVEGTIYSTLGGFKFPDGSVQLTAATGGVGGSGTPNTIAKFSSSTAIGDSVITESDGNVGIGTTTPGATLTVNGPMIRRIVRRQGYTQDGTDNGPLADRSVNFTKTQSDTGIRVSWSDTFRVLGNGKACQWEIKFNGSSCTSPGGLYVSKLQYSGDAGTSDEHDPTTMVATCMNLPAGNYTIQGYVGPTPGYSGVDCYTGWSSLFSLEAEEVY